DGHTLATVIPAMEDMIGNTIERLLADAGYRGHNAPTDYKFRVYTSGQKRRLTPQIKRELRRRAAIEPVIGHLKAEHRMGRNYLAHHAGDAVNAVLAAAIYLWARPAGAGETPGGAGRAGEEENLVPRDLEITIGRFC